MAAGRELHLVTFGVRAFVGAREGIRVVSGVMSDAPRSIDSAGLISRCASCRPRTEGVPPELRRGCVPQTQLMHRRSGRPESTGRRGLRYLGTSMPHGPFFVESRGSCIYCGATGVPLTDEHVVPLSIGGSHVLRKASCRPCAAVTSRFERKVMRDLWGDARIAFDAPTRRKGRRPRKMVLPDAGGRAKGRAVPVEEYPAGFVFYKMCQAGFLQGLPPDVDVSRKWQFVVIDDDGRRRRFLEKHPPHALRLRFRHVPDAFGRLLAKIGYGQVLTQLDPSDFRPICLPYILGSETNVSYIVGGTLDDQDPEPDVGYRLETAGFGSADRLVLVALIRLLANTAAPAYHVVVGEVLGVDRIHHVAEKLQIVIERAHSEQDAAGDSPPHWAPKSVEARE